MRAPGNLPSCILVSETNSTDPNGDKISLFFCVVFWPYTTRNISAGREAIGALLSQRPEVAIIKGSGIRDILDLLIFGGLPGTGKSTIARLLAARLGAVWLRIDSIEQALIRAETVTRQ